MKTFIVTVIYNGYVEQFSYAGETVGHAYEQFTDDPMGIDPNDVYSITIRAMDSLDWKQT